MYFRDLLHLRRTSYDAVPMDVLRSLQLPVPEDVLEQFLHDHGTKHEFQAQYGHLDLQRISWREIVLPGGEIIECSVYPGFVGYIADITRRMRDVHEFGWKSILLPPGAAEHWQSKGTWMRSPVFLRGSLVESPALVHLVEGHTRLGALRGLVESGVVAPSSQHSVWVGEPDAIGTPTDAWREVLLRERMPFLQWLFQQMDPANEVGQLAMALAGANVNGDDFASVMSHVQGNVALARFARTVTAAHAEWQDARPQV